MTLEIPLEAIIDKELASEIVKESAFVSPHIKSFHLDLSKQIARIELDSDQHRAVISEQTGRSLEAMTKGCRAGEAKTIFTHERKFSRFEAQVHDKLLEHEWVYEIGPRHVSLAGPALHLFHLIDSKALELYQGGFNLIERSFYFLWNGSGIRVF